MLLLSLPILATPNTDGKTKSDSVKFGFEERMAIHTNTLGWLLMTPNAGFEYDVYRTRTRKVSVLVSGRFNPATNQEPQSRYVYNIAGAHLEGRWYFRTRQRREWEKDYVKTTPGFFNRLKKSTRFITARNNPSEQILYYVGPYIGYDKVTMKFGDTGKQGSALSAGLTLGYSAPLYTYDNGSAIDLELGASLGLINKVDYEEFSYNSEDKCYVYDGKEESKILPYPVVSDLRLSLVYRMRPATEQTVVVDEKKVEYEQKTYEQRLIYMDNFDNIWGSDELPEGYNGKFMPDEDVVIYSEEYMRAVSKYKDSIMRAHYAEIAEYNREISQENERIRRINERILAIEGADSTMLIEELRPAYRYVQMPRNLLVSGSKSTLPNDSFTSVSDFNVRYLNELVSRYPMIKNEEGVASVDKRIMTDYALLREIHLAANDSTSPISYFELLVKAIPNINQFSIKPHNDKYIFREKSDSSSVVPIRYLSMSRDTLQHDSNNHGAAKTLSKTAVPFLDGSQATIYLKEKGTGGIESMNDRIKAKNYVKITELENMFGVPISDESVNLREEELKEEKRREREAEIAAKEAAEAEEARLKAEAKAAKEAAKAAKIAAKEEAKAEKARLKSAENNSLETVEGAVEEEIEEAEAVETVQGDAQSVVEDAEEDAETVMEEATEKIDESAEVVEEQLDEKAATKAEKERQKAEKAAAKKAAKDAAKAEKERIKAEKEAAKAAAKAAKEAAKAAAKAEKEAAKEAAKAAKEAAESNDVNGNLENE